MSILDEYEIICPCCGEKRSARDWEDTAEYIMTVKEFLKQAEESEYTMTENFCCPYENEWHIIRFPRDFIKVDDVKYFFIEYEVT